MNFIGVDVDSIFLVCQIRPDGKPSIYAQSLKRGININPMLSKMLLDF